MTRDGTYKLVRFIALGWPADTAFWELREIVDVWEELLADFSDAEALAGFDDLCQSDERPKRAPGIGEVIVAAKPYRERRAIRDAAERRRERFAKDDEQFAKLNELRDEEQRLARAEGREVDPPRYHERFNEWLKEEARNG